MDVHSPTAPGWTHVLDGEDQLALDDDVAAALVLLCLITYSPDDGPFARVYRLCDGVTLETVRHAIA